MDEGHNEVPDEQEREHAGGGRAKLADEVRILFG